MEIQGRYLIVALLAVLTYLPAAPSGTALGQRANQVIIRATVPEARPGRVTARVTVSKSRVLVGEWVMVTIVPPAGVKRPLFKINFGDGREEVTRNRQIDHKYTKVGHYDIYAWVETPQPPPVPRVFLSVAPNSTGVGERVTFNAKLDTNYPGIKYRFVFGDKNQTAWQDRPQTAHSYAMANTYRAYVDIGAEENGSITSLGGSAREPVRVNAQPGDSVNLNANPTTVEVGRLVTFTARAVTRNPNVSYRFVFGDGSATDWQAGPRATHDYASPKTYHAHVQMRANSFTFSTPIVSSARLPIQVIERPEQLTVDLAVNPTTVNTETLVTLTAKANSSDRNIRYRFVYGDGSISEWQGRVRSTHRYPIGNHFAYVEVGRLNNNQGINVGATSSKIQVSVTRFVPPTPTPSPTATPTPTPRPSPSPSATPTPASSPTPSPGGSPSASPGSSPESSPGSSPLSSPGSSPLSSPGLPGTISKPSPPFEILDSIERNWWKVLLIVLLISFVGYRTYKFLFAPRPTFRPVPDTGGSGVDEATNPLAINSQILLKPDIADGLYRVSTDEPSLVRSIRREND